MTRRRWSEPTPAQLELCDKMGIGNLVNMEMGLWDVQRLIDSVKRDRAVIAAEVAARMLASKKGVTRPTKLQQRLEEGDTRFCIFCGTRMERPVDVRRTAWVKKRRCTNCHGKDMQDDRFCTRCGTTFTVAKSAMTGGTGLKGWANMTVCTRCAPE